MIDNEELTVELQEKGIGVVIGEVDKIYTVHLKYMQSNEMIAIASEPSVEAALSTVIRKLADDSKRLKSSYLKVSEDISSIL